VSCGRVATGCGATTAVQGTHRMNDTLNSNAPTLLEISPTISIFQLDVPKNLSFHVQPRGQPQAPRPRHGNLDPSMSFADWPTKLFLNASISQVDHCKLTLTFHLYLFL
jgi:hypothetical protein